LTILISLRRALVRRDAFTLSIWSV
jgi:hypothetical protein